jgi:oxygen-independent coproporphyrinogen-3 oxidase
LELEIENGGQKPHPGLYIHVPFCNSKCPYCGFYSTVSKSGRSEWVEALIKEMEIYHGEFDGFDTIYLGGGTPSCLDTNDLKKILKGVKVNLDLYDDLEITMESNPSDLSLEKIKAIKELNINRINLGIQSFDNNDLKVLGRRHTSSQAIEAIKDLRECDFNNLGIDLIYGLPGQTIKKWKRNLEEAVSFKPEHISCYELTIEKKTPFSVRLKKGSLKLPDEDLQAELFLKTSEFLQEQGYLHYEVSNFSKGESNISRHNSKYWDRTPYLGLGPSAHSFQNSTRWWNVSSVRRYCEALENGKQPVKEVEGLTEEQILQETVSLGLRTCRGIEMAVISKRPEWEKMVTDMVNSGHIQIKGSRVIPTLKGLLVADYLPLSFF